MGNLYIVDLSGNIIGEDSRENIHKKGLLHREVNVWFHTPNKQIIFQKRSKTKDTFPSLLSTTVGGHVEIGMDFLETAVSETFEETGQVISQTDLVFVKSDTDRYEDRITGNINNRIQNQYLYLFTGNIEELEIEKDKSDGFEAWDAKVLLQLSMEDSKKFAPGVISSNISLINKVVSLV